IGNSAPRGRLKATFRCGNRQFRTSRQVESDFQVRESAIPHLSAWWALVSVISTEARRAEWRNLSSAEIDKTAPRFMAASVFHSPRDTVASYVAHDWLVAFVETLIYSVLQSGSSQSAQKNGSTGSGYFLDT
ncbi:MAG: hypothetical protein IJ623_09010, partial [Bacteroidales bacterium]|nr:hypothetical protein [Bacteroidales bacterium]